MKKLRARILNWSSNTVSFPDMPSMSAKYTDYLDLVRPAKLKTRSAEEDMMIVAEDISRAAAKVLAQSYSNKNSGNLNVRAR